MGEEIYKEITEIKKGDRRRYAVKIKDTCCFSVAKAIVLYLPLSTSISFYLLFFILLPQLSQPFQLPLPAQTQLFQR